MTSLLSINIPLLAYRYISNYGPNDEPVGSVTIAVYEDSNNPPAVGTGWCCDDDCCCKCNDQIGCCSGTFDKLKTNPNLFKGTGFTIDGNTIILVFDEVIGKKWRNKTLVPKNVCIDSAPFPIVKLPFSPSIENLAYVIYQIMKIELSNKYNCKLAYVDVIHPSGDFARYEGK